ncbi:MAG: type I DNA topoisomerase [Pseudomonadota bacterium]
MSKNLVIVESPAKAKTIKKYLGPGYEVMASYGHVRDLVPKDGAVDTANGFTMKYQVIDRNAKHVSAIAAALKSADNLILATDPDREGEAISWHLVELLRERKLLKEKSVKRVVFYEITQREVQKAIAEPREIAADLVNAQQARRALDYLVGFNLSPLLWRKVQPGLSAGRVQSPALRLICEREEEIRKFIPQEYWTVEAQADKSGSAFKARLVEFRGKKLEQFTLGKAGEAETAKKLILDAAKGELLVASIDKKQRRRNPAPPFTTSTLQQEANRKLGFTSKRTMQAAQRLFEGVDIGGETVGLISYMRTDSVSLSQDALTEIRSVIKKKYPKALPSEARVYKTKSKNAQEAHEAVRPTSAARTPDSVKDSLLPDQARLYELIWRRTMASQMEAAVFDTMAVELKAGDAHAFRANGQTLVEAGYLAVYNIHAEDPADDDHEDDEARLPPLEEGERVKLLDVIPEQHFTEPPPRFTEASLVKTLEEYDIGRPSTYASIISTLVARNYVVLQGKAFMPTDVGLIVNRFLVEHFSKYVDYKFTAHLEEELDEISRGEREWVPVLEEFWGVFKPMVDAKLEVDPRTLNKARMLGTDPVSGKPVTTRLGRFGPFVQIGEKVEGGEKPRYASLRGIQRIDTITLADAIELFKLPRKLGVTAEGVEVVANIGRFGPYVKHGNNFVSMKREDDPFTIELPRALELIEGKRLALIAATVKEFDGSPVKIIKGRFGPYITDGAKKARIPRGVEFDSLSLEQCLALIAEQNAAPAKKARKPKAEKVVEKKPAVDKKPKVVAKPAKPKKVTAKTKKASSA